MLAFPDPVAYLVDWESTFRAAKCAIAERSMHFLRPGQADKGNAVAKRVDLPDEVLELIAERFRTLGDGTRLKILRQLMRDGQSTVTQVVERSGCSLANTSKQLKRLGEAGILKRTKQPPHVFYEICDPVVLQICELVCGSVAAKLRSRR